jgi:hypothetical protein
LQRALGALGFDSAGWIASATVANRDTPNRLAGFEGLAAPVASHGRYG